MFRSQEKQHGFTSLMPLQGQCFLQCDCFCTFWRNLLFPNLSQRQVLGGKKNLGGGLGNKELVSVNPLFFDRLWVVTPGKAYLQFSAERKAGGREHVFVGQCLGGGNGNPFQYSCLENPMDSGAWWATAHGVIRSWMWLSDWACRRLSLQNCFRCFAVFTV